MPHFIFMLGLIMFALPAHAKVVGKTINYQVAGEMFTGYLAYDDALAGKRPGVLVVHEWWGHNAYARHRADMLAALGYTAFALDMYGTGQQADHPKDAMAFMQALTSDSAKLNGRFTAGLNQLKSADTTDSQHIAAIGYCMGGGIALNMARSGADLAGVAVFHGGLNGTTAVKKGDIKGEILVMMGEADPFIPQQQVAAFQAEMNAADVKYQLITYPGAKHSFTNPEADIFAAKFDMPVAYDRAADVDSWQHMQAFLARVLAK